ncbi:helix-turn-helix domain-containing protein [Bacillus sp. CDB3]|uniref:helix-turn-helix domain-containing protein n=1 Tax=Bacillus sp. CDB3 TaxID=360310 RepID=UPI0009D812D5|nr:helix-turn-helix transcriptional regulator [Bacillus sp. CDB3]OQR53520.1 transcriptional regulator [Bacillus sp. CDB3]
MNTLGLRIKQLRQKQKMSQEELATMLGMGRVNISHYERGIITNIPSDVLLKLSDIFNVSIDYLLGKTEHKDQKIIKDYEGFTEKDRKDIGKRMEEIRKDLTDTDGLMFSGEPLSEEALDSLMDAMEYIVKHTQKVNKKYIPKKYRKESE